MKRKPNTVDSVETRVRQVIVDSGCIGEENITNSAKLMDDLGLDSLDVVEVFMGLEDEFGIEIPDDDMDACTTVQGVVAYINERIAH